MMNETNPEKNEFSELYLTQKYYILDLVDFDEISESFPVIDYYSPFLPIIGFSRSPYLLKPGLVRVPKRLNWVMNKSETLPCQNIIEESISNKNQTYLIKEKYAELNPNQFWIRKIRFSWENNSLLEGIFTLEDVINNDHLNRPQKKEIISFYTQFRQN